VVANFLKQTQNPHKKVAYSCRHKPHNTFHMSSPDPQFTQVSIWVNQILLGIEEDLEFDEMYSTVFEALDTPDLNLYIDSLSSSFSRKVEDLCHELFDVGGSATDFSDLCYQVLLGIRKLATVFYPATLTGIDVQALLTGLARNCLFSEGNAFVSTFLRTFAHSLPGSLNLESQRDVLEMIVPFLKSKGQLERFVNDVIEATDSMTAFMTGRWLSGGDSDGLTAMRYLGFCQVLMENEEKLWALFPPQQADRLRGALLDGMIKSVAPEVLFGGRFAEGLNQCLFDDLRQLPVLAPVLRRLFVDRGVLRELGLSAIVFFGEGLAALAESLLKDGKPRRLLLTEVNNVVHQFIDVFEKLSLLDELLFQDRQFRADSEDTLRFHMEQPAFAANLTFPQYVHQCIEAMANDRQKQHEQVQRLLRLRQLVPFLPNREEFANEHNHQMLVRLFHTAGLQYKLEQTAFTILECFFSPGFTQRYRQNVQFLEKSEEIHKKWRISHQTSPLEVLVVPATALYGARAQLSWLKLPPFFARHAAAFEQFYRPLERGKGKLQWIYDENQVVLRLYKAGAYDIQLTVPLVLACVIAAVKDLGSPTPGQLADYLGMAPGGAQVAEALARVLSHQDGALLIVRNTISFNPGFRPVHARRFKFSAPTNFGLVRDKVEDTMRYEAYIAEVLKKGRSLTEDQIKESVTATFRTRGGTYSESGFWVAMEALRQRGWIKKDRAKWRFVPG
jgi:hypothetical protein